MASVVHVDLEIEDGGWRAHLVVPNQKVHFGVIERVGNLPGGMKSGAPAFQLLGRLDNGEVVHLQASWKNIALAMVALIARWGTP